MTYEMSRKIANTGWFQLVLGGAVVIGIYMFHGTLRQAVMVQLVLMLFLLLAVSLSFLLHYRDSDATAELAVPGIQKLRPATEAEVIAEFLKAEFHHSEFEHDRKQFEQLVQAQDLTDEHNNARRRALLFRRRGRLWRELPRDTEWWEVQLRAEYLDRIRVLPCAQWRAVSDGSYLIKDIVEQMRSGKFSGKKAAFIDRVRSLSKLFAEGGRTNNTSVILIGENEGSPLTIIEGNHRLTAGLWASPEIVAGNFRVFCGFSKDMTQCCWYDTGFVNLLRHAKNRLKYLLYDQESDIRRVSPTVAPASGSDPARAMQA